MVFRGGQHSIEEADQVSLNEVVHEQFKEVGHGLIDET